MEHSVVTSSEPGKVRGCASKGVSSDNMKHCTEYDRQEDASDVTEGQRSKVRRMRRAEDAQVICQTVDDFSISCDDTVESSLDLCPKESL